MFRASPRIHILQPSDMGVEWVGAMLTATQFFEVHFLGLLQWGCGTIIEARCCSPFYLDALPVLSLVRGHVIALTLPPPPLVRSLPQVLRDEERMYIVTPFYSGGELFERVTDKGRFLEDEARPLFRQVLKGLRHLKRHGVCHRSVLETS